MNGGLATVVDVKHRDTEYRDDTKTDAETRPFVRGKGLTFRRNNTTGTKLEHPTMRGSAQLERERNLFPFRKPSCLNFHYDAARTGLRQ